MKLHRPILVIIVSLLPLLAIAASPAQQKQFADSYRKALEAKDENALYKFMYTRDADPDAVDIYKMMMRMGLGKKIQSVEVHELNAEDRKDVAGLTDMENKPIKYNVEPVAKLEIVRGDESSRHTDRVFLAEKDGKLVIPVPGKAK